MGSNSILLSQNEACQLYSLVPTGGAWIKHWGYPQTAALTSLQTQLPHLDLAEDPPLQAPPPPHRAASQGVGWREECSFRLVSRGWSGNKGQVARLLWHHAVSQRGWWVWLSLRLGEQVV